MERGGPESPTVPGASSALTGCRTAGLGRPVDGDAHTEGCREPAPPRFADYGASNIPPIMVLSELTNTDGFSSSRVTSLGSGARPTRPPGGTPVLEPRDGPRVPFPEARDGSEAGSGICSAKSVPGSLPRNSTEPLNPTGRLEVDRINHPAVRTI